MKRARLNERDDWTFWVPDNVANWDAISNWERERLASMEQHLNPGDVLYDIGSEHGWLSAIYGTFVGHENMVLVEPSPFFWPNIRMVWEMNAFPAPFGCFCAYVGMSFSEDLPAMGWAWPPECLGPECDAQAYVSLAHENLHNIPTIDIDWMALRLKPDAITIDIEGAELLALLGAAQVLVVDRPLVWVSVHPDLMARDYGTDHRDLHRYMHDHEYDGTLLAIDHEEHWLFTPREQR